MAENENKNEELAENPETPEEQAEEAAPAEDKQEEMAVDESEVTEEEAIEEPGEVEEAAAEADEAEEAEEKPVVKQEKVEPAERVKTGYEKVRAIKDGMVRTDIPDFRAGDTVKVHVKIIEGNKERIQVFEGVVIAIKHGGLDQTFTVRKTSWGVGVERTFFLNSTKLDKVVVSRRGRVRRAKLYYLRQRAGKSARIRERRMHPGK